MTGGQTEDGTLILAVDLGSTAVKAAVLDLDSRIVGTGSATQQTRGDEVGAREHDPARIWQAVGRSVRRALAEAGTPHRVAAVSVTGPRGTFGVLDSGGWRTRFLTWQDRRAAAATAELAGHSGGRYRSVVGASPDTSAILPKLLWLRDREPGVFGGSWRIATPQGYVLEQLGADDHVIDLSVAGHVGLLDVSSLTWSAALLEAFDIPAAALPRLVPPGAQVGRLRPSVAARLGLTPGIPLVAAGSDGVCSELGAGVTAVGQVYGYLGTAAAVAGPLTAPELPDDPALILMPGSTAERWRILGLGMAGGSARDWFMRTHGIRDQGRVEQLLGESPAGARGVLFIPTLAGATAPVPDGRARAVFAGMSIGTTAADLGRAVHEGVALEMRWLVEAIAGSTVRPSELRLTGGGSRSDGWARILADVIGLPVARIREPNPGLVGAAAYALVAIGRFPSVLAAAVAVKTPSDRFDPRRELAGAYDDAAGIYALVRRSFRDGGVDERLFRRTMDSSAGAHPAGDARGR